MSTPGGPGVAGPSASPLWGPVTTCMVCGRVAEGETLPIDWTLDFSDRGPRPVCPGCTRDKLRDIEGKLGLGEPWDG